MDNQEYISIKEFAERAGVSRQSVYKAVNQVDSKLTAFVNLVDNRKMLNIKALEEIYGVQVDSKLTTSCQPETTYCQPEKNLNQQFIESLQQQLRSKDEQIERLTNALEKSQETATAALETVKAAQVLQATAEKKLLELEQKNQEESSSKIDSEVVRKKHWWSCFIKNINADSKI